MALDPISVGSADDDGTGDALRTAFTKVNANDSYLEGLIAARGKNWKPYVRAATTANISLATDLEAGDTLDGVTLAEGDRVLVKDQTAGAENGIYDVPASGAASRSDDSDTGDELLLAAVLVSEGTVNADKLFVCTTDAPITVDTTALVWDDRTPGGGGATEATDAQLHTGVSTDTVLSPRRLYTVGQLVALVDEPNISADLNTGLNFKVTIAGNRTLDNPTNAKEGQSGIIRVTQDATGSRTLAFGTKYLFAGGSATLSTDANAVDIIAYYVDDAGDLLCTLSTGFAAT